MYLWNDYEGQLLAGAFSLEKLLRTEGRHAFFSTRDHSGAPAVIRLTEALNDQDQLRARYSAVQSAGKEHLVAIEAYGEEEVDGQPLFYLVMEPTQESLADILSTRRLSIEETNEVANAVVGAVEALHAKGLVHGQVDPGNVLAAGDVIKLRSDCVRLAPEGADGARVFAADVLGMANVLNQSLTQAPLEDASDALALPEPYASIVRNVFRGSWGIEQVAAELRRFVRPTAVSKPTAPVPAPQPEIRKAPPAAAPPVSIPAATAGSAAGYSVREPLAEKQVPPPAARREESRPISSRAGIAPNGPLAPLPTNGKGHAEAQLPLAYAQSDATSKVQEREASTFGVGSWHEPEEESAGLMSRPVVWIGGGVVLLLLLFLLWHMSGSKSAGPKAQNGAATQAAALSPATAPVPAAGAAAGPNSAAPAPVADAKPSAAIAGPASAAGNAAATGGRVWRVVAYTYNSEAKAEAQARLIDARHHDIRAEAFTGTGHAPYLVTLGGPMTREQAIALRAKARKEGLAHGAYIQNYSH